MPPTVLEPTPAQAKAAAPDPQADLAVKDIADLVIDEVNKHAAKLSADEREKIGNAAKEAVEKYSKEFADDFLRRNPQMHIPGLGDKTKNPKDQWSFGRAIASLRERDQSIAPLEWEAHRQMKALQTVSDTSAGLLIPSQMQDEIIMPLRDRSVSKQLGVRFASGKGYIGFEKRRRVADLVASWVAEGAPVIGSDLKYTKMELKPRALRAKETVSNLMLEQAADLVHSEITESAKSQFELAGDKAILVGSGQGNEPRGIANTDGIGTSTLAGPTYDQLLDFVSVVRVAKALSGPAGWAISPEKFNAIQKIKDPTDNSQPLERRMLASGPIDTLVGFPFQWTGQLPSSGLNASIFGVFSNAFFLSFGSMRIRVSDMGNTDMDNDATTVVVVLYADVGVDQPKAFCVASA